MDEREKQIQALFTAELQFRLASAVRLATTRKVQPLDLPIEWTHGRHRVEYAEIALRDDQAEYAACFMQRTATHMMAVVIKDAIRAVVHDPKSSADSKIVAAYQIARLIRNAFTHGPLSPVWSIDPNCHDLRFVVPDVITLDTTGLQGTPFDWRHYGGPLALFRLSQFVRLNILGHEPTPRQIVPQPRKIIQQQGNLLIEKVDAIPTSAVPVAVERRSDGGIDLGGGHVLYDQRPDES